MLLCAKHSTHMILFNPQCKVGIITLPFLNEEPEYPRGQISCLKSQEYRGKASTGTQNSIWKLPPQGFRLSLLLEAPHHTVWDGCCYIFSLESLKNSMIFCKCDWSGKVGKRGGRRVALKMKRLLVITTTASTCGRLNICSGGSHTPPTLCSHIPMVG